MDTHRMALEAKHADLDARITAETRRPAPDELQVHRWKKEKLMIKQEITRS